MFYIHWFVFLYCGDTNSVFKIPGFRQDIQSFKDKNVCLLSKILKNFLKNIVDFPAHFVYDFLHWFVFLYRGDTNSVFKIPVFVKKKYLQNFFFLACCIRPIL